MARVVVHSVVEDTGAAKAGLQAGDIVVAADGHPVYETGDLLMVRRNHGVGDTVVLTIRRDGKTFDAEIVLKSSRD